MGITAKAMPASKSSYNDDNRKQINYGFLTTRVLIVEKEPLIGDGTMTAGQLIDQRLNQLRNPWGERTHTEAPHDFVPPIIHSITLDFPPEE